MAPEMVWRDPASLIMVKNAQQRIEVVQCSTAHAVTGPVTNASSKQCRAKLPEFEYRRLLSTRGQMLKIQRSSNGEVEVVFTLSGRMDEEQMAELEALIKSEAKGHRIVLDLKDLTLVGRDAMSFLERCEEGGITLKNCPAYVREWINREED